MILLCMVAITITIVMGHRYTTRKRYMVVCTVLLAVVAIELFSIILSTYLFDKILLFPFNLQNMDHCN